MSLAIRYVSTMLRFPRRRDHRVIKTSISLRRVGAENVSSGACPQADLDGVLVHVEGVSGL